MIESLARSPRTSENQTFYEPLDSSFGIQLEARQSLHLRKIAQRAWADLPYTMMGLTETYRPAEGLRPYWRDQNVYLGEFELVLTSNTPRDEAPICLATYTRDRRRRSFRLQPSLDGEELRWSAPDLSNGIKLTTEQLAAELLQQLVRFYVRSHSVHTSTSSVSPDLSS